MGINKTDVDLLSKMNKNHAHFCLPLQKMRKISKKKYFFDIFSPLWNAVLLLSFFLVFYSVRVNWRLFHAPQTKVILSKPDMGWLELQRSKKPGIFTQDALGSLFWPSVDMRSNLITSEILRWFLAGIFYPFVHQRLICHVRDVLLAHLVIQGISKIRAKRATTNFLKHR